MMTALKQNKGFTLIELLVVIAIISLLASVVLAFLNPARSKSRNAKRNSDIKQLVNAFNLGLDANSNSFPTPASASACVSSSCYGTWSVWTADPATDAYLAPYISKTSDPTDSTRTKGGYTYSNPLSPGIAPHDGYVFPSGAYLTWMVEAPISSTSCGTGRIYSANATQIACFMELN